MPEHNPLLGRKSLAEGVLDLTHPFGSLTFADFLLDMSERTDLESAHLPFSVSFLMICGSVVSLSGYRSLTVCVRCWRVEGEQQ
jgi:hypothetical protein